MCVSKAFGVKHDLLNLVFKATRHVSFLLDEVMTGLRRVDIDILNCKGGVISASTSVDVCRA
jgi:hypothetical protein